MSGPPQKSQTTATHAIPMARRLPLAAVALGLAVAMVGIGHLVAWLGGYLGEASLGAFIMKTNLALCFLLLGAALVLAAWRGEAPLRRWCVRFAAGLSLVIGALTVGENVFGWDFGIDQLLASEPPGALGMVSPNRMGLPASASVVAISLGLLAASGRGRTAVRVAQWVALGVCLIALLGIIGHLYGVQMLYGVARVTAIAWPSAAALLALGIGLLLVRPTEGLMAQVTADDPGGMTLRRWLPVLPLPVVLGYFRILGERNQWFDAETGTAATMVLFIVALAVLAYVGSRPVSRSAAARAAADEALRDAERQKSLVLDNANESIALHDCDNNLIWANKAYLASTNLPLADLKGRKCHSCWGLDRLCENCPVVTAIRTGQPQEAELTPQNQSHWPAEQGSWLVRAAPVMDDAGNIVGAIEVAHDITDRKRVQEEMARMSALMTEGQEIAHVGSFEFVAATGSTVWSPEEFRIYGLDPLGPAPTYKEMLAKCYLPEDARRLHETFAAAMQAKGVYDLEHRIIRPDGSVRWVHDRAHPHLDDRGNVVRYVGATLDITDRKRAEEAVASAHQQLQSIIDNTTSMVYACDLEERFVLANTALAVLLKTTPEQMIGKRRREFMPQADADAHEADDRKVIAAGRAVEFEEYSELQGRSITWWSTKFPLRDAQGRIYGVAGIVTDISARKQAEEALALKNAQLQALFDYSAASLVLFDAKPPYTVLAHNKYYQKLWGEPFRSQGMVGKNLLDYVPEAEASGVMAIYDEVARTKQARNLLNFPYDGMERGRTWWNWHLSPVMQGEKVVALAHMGIDVTNEVKARQEAEGRAREAEEGKRTLDALMDYTPEGITIVSAPDIRTIRTSNYGDRMLTDGWQTSGLSMEDWLAKVEHYLADGVTPAGTEDLPLVRAVKYGETIEGKELILRRPGGEPMPVLCNAGPIRDRTGAVTGAVVAWRDITEMKKAMADLQQTADELARSNRELEQFAYISAHDLQEPLRQVRAYVGRLKDLHSDKFEGKAAQYFDFVYDGAARMSELVRGLLEYSRVRSRDAVHQPTATEQTLDAALANLQAGIDESRAIITRDQLPTVTAEPTQLAQLFQNLIGNAIKFRSPERPCQVHVAARKLDGHWEFSVKDNGIGIGQEFHEKVFVIFRRLHTREQYPGTGIGLAICKKIVERHGGRIWIESKAGEGTTFCFTLPEASSR